jgi:mutator protein MutT
MEKIVVRAIILNEEGKVLIGKRVGGHGDGKWALIGGKLDENETKEQTIIREVKEEIGVDLINPVLWKEEIDEISILGEKWKVIYFYGNISGKTKLKLDEISEIKYISPEDLNSLEIAFDHDVILREFFNKRK